MKKKENKKNWGQTEEKKQINKNRDVVRKPAEEKKQLKPHERIQNRENVVEEFI